MNTERVTMETQLCVLFIVQLGTFCNAYTSSATPNKVIGFHTKAIYATGNNKN